VKLRQDKYNSLKGVIKVGKGWQNRLNIVKYTRLGVTYAKEILR
jgi:hypothetical protein